MIGIKNAVSTLLMAGDQLATTTTSAAFDAKDYEGSVLITLGSAAGTGTTPTLDVKIQHCATSGGTYADISGAAFTQVDDTAGGSGQGLALNIADAERYLKVVATIAGTTPKFSFGVVFSGVKKETT